MTTNKVIQTSCTVVAKTTGIITVPHLCLHHKGPVHAQIVYDAINVYNIFSLNLEDQAVYGYEGTCAPNTGTEFGQTDTMSDVF